MLLPLVALALIVAASKSRTKVRADDDDLSRVVRDANEALSTISPDFTARAVSGFDGGSMQNLDPWAIHIGFRRGHAVAIQPATGARAAVRLRDVAKHMGRKGRRNPRAENALPPTIAGDEDLLGYLDLYDDGPNATPIVSGKIARKMKTAVKKVAKVAKKVVNNKIVKAIGGMVAKVLPPPLSTGFAAVQMGVSVAKKIANAAPGSKAHKAKPIVSQLAAGQITRQQAETRAQQIGVNPTAIVATGVALKLRSDAQRGNPQARALFAVSDRVNAAGTSPAAARAAVQMVRSARPA